MDSCHTYRYESVFAHASFQFCGHIDEYLIANSRNLTLIRFQTRFGKGGHRIEWYKEGKKVKEQRLCSSRNILLYYILMFIHHNRELWRCSHHHKSSTIAIFTHPIGCFGMSIQRLFSNVKYVFWIWDWFPPLSLSLKIYAIVLKFYARRTDFTYTLTGSIAEKIGLNVPVVMLGMKRLPCADADRSATRRILVVGQLRHGQGVEDALQLIVKHPEYSLTLMGMAANGFEHTINDYIHQNHIEERVSFPNRFVSQEELSKEATNCFCGLALYDMAPNNLTHYADPGKVKSYLEMGLPVVMTRISTIAPEIEKHKAGEIIDSLTELPSAVARIINNPLSYAAGAKSFSDHFEYEPYYNKMFSF